MIVRMAKEHKMTAESLYYLTNEAIILSGTPGAENLATGGEKPTSAEPREAPNPPSPSPEQPAASKGPKE
eukprot:12280065-Karenia_brevis.AAC.1